MIAETTKCAMDVLKVMEKYEKTSGTGKGALTEVIEKSQSLNVFADDKKLEALKTKMAFPNYPPVRLAILGWGPPLLAIALIVVFVSVSIISW